MVNKFSSREERNYDLSGTTDNQSDSYYTAADREFILDQARQATSSKIIAKEVGLTISQFRQNLKQDESLYQEYQNIISEQRQSKQTQKDQDRQKCLENSDLILGFLDEPAGNLSSLASDLNVNLNSVVGHIYESLFVDNVDQIINQVEAGNDDQQIAASLNLPINVYTYCLSYDGGVYRLYLNAQKSSTKKEDGEAKPKKITRAAPVSAQKQKNQPPTNNRRQSAKDCRRADNWRDCD